MTSPLKKRSNASAAKKKQSLGKGQGVTQKRSSVERPEEMQPENRSSIHDLLKEQEKAPPARIDDADKKKGIVLLCDDEEDLQFVEAY